MGFVFLVPFVNLYPTAGPLFLIFSTNIRFHLSVISLTDLFASLCDSCYCSLQYLVSLSDLFPFHWCVFKSMLSPRSRNPGNPIINFMLKISTETHLRFVFFLLILTGTSVVPLTIMGFLSAPINLSLNLSSRTCGFIYSNTFITITFSITLLSNIALMCSP